MIRVRQVLVKIEDNNLKEKVASKLKININNIKSIKINKRSIDARHKPDLYYVYEVDCDILNEDDILNKNKSNDLLKTPNEEYKFDVTGNINLNNRPIIVGTGPAGLFAAYMLSKYKYNPIIIERGEDIDSRVKKVEEFWNTGVLDINSNVQFGEGGAGTFSDGKLNTLVKDPLFRNKKVLEVFVECGAPEDILYDNKPHIGTDILRTVIKNLRNKMIEYGATFKYNTTLNDIKIENEKVVSVKLNDEWINTDILLLAIGHSARDTFKMLYERNLNMEGKPFAVGVRVSHNQEMISKSQYGINYKLLKPASYKLTHKASNGRGVYSFCMCPGGYVVNASSENNRLAINGMSNHDRESKNANSAIIVTVSPKDYGEHPLDGIEFQRMLEEKTYKVGEGKIPIQTFKDFKNDNETIKLGDVEPIFKGNYTLANLNSIFPNYITEALIEGINAFDRKIKGFNSDDTIIAAIESRTSSPVRILRDDNCESNIKGIYPIGEGAGYAGGITSAAMDGLKVAEAIASKYINKN